jgi:hypothetical protein
MLDGPQAVTVAANPLIETVPGVVPKSDPSIVTEEPGGPPNGDKSVTAGEGPEPPVRFEPEGVAVNEGLGKSLESKCTDVESGKFVSDPVMFATKVIVLPLTLAVTGDPETLLNPFARPVAMVAAALLWPYVAALVNPFTVTYTVPLSCTSTAQLCP